MENEHVRIDQKVLVKDLVKDDHWSASKVVRERLANRVRESNFFFRERLRQKGSAITRAKVSRKIRYVFAKDRMTERLREPAGESFAKDNFSFVKNGRFV